MTPNDKRDAIWAMQDLAKFKADIRDDINKATYKVKELEATVRTQARQLECLRRWIQRTDFEPLLEQLRTLNG